MSPTARLALRVLASLAALVVVAVVVGGQALRAGTAVLAPGPVLLALLLGTGWRVLAATRWVVLSRALGAPLAWWPAVTEYFRSELVNQVVPGGVVGDVDRARRHGRDVGLLAAARAVFLERAAGQVVLVVATGLVLLRRPELLGVSAGVDARSTAVLLALLVVVAAVAGVLWRPWRGRAAGRTGPRAREQGDGRGDPDTRVLRRAPVTGWGLLAPAAAALVLSGGVLACFVTLFVVAAGATGAAPSPLGVLVPAVLVVLLVSGVPLTVSGWGAREAGAALCFAAVGLVPADGVAAAVGYGLLSLVSALPGLVPLLLPRHRAHAGPQVQVEADVLAQREHP